MRSFILTAAVAGLGSVAQAQVAELVVKTPPEVDGGYFAGSTIEVALVSDVEVSGISLRTITDDAPVTGIAAGEQIYSGFNFAVNDGLGFRVNAGGVLYDRPGGDAISGSYLALLPGPGSNAPAGETLWSFDYTIDGAVPMDPPTLVTLDIVGSGGVDSLVIAVGGAPISPTGVTFKVVPEPTSMILLVVGGAILLRRRRR